MAIYAGILGILLFKISLETIKARKTHRISLGTGDNAQIQAIVSAHSNFVAYTPLFLILLYSIERYKGYPSLLFHTLGCLFILGRLLHYKSFTKEKMDFKNRVRGMKLTLLPILILSFSNIVMFCLEFVSKTEN